MDISKMTKLSYGDLSLSSLLFSSLLSLSLSLSLSLPLLLYIFPASSLYLSICIALSFSSSLSLSPSLQSLSLLSFPRGSIGFNLK